MVPQSLYVGIFKLENGQIFTPGVTQRLFFAFAMVILLADNIQSNNSFRLIILQRARRGTEVFPVFRVSGELNYRFKRTVLSLNSVNVIGSWFFYTQRLFCMFLNVILKNTLFGHY